MTVLRRMLFLFFLFVCQLFTTGMGNLPQHFNVAAIPIDIGPFLSVQGEESYYLRRFPRVLRDLTDEAIFNVFSKGTQIKQKHPEGYEPSPTNSDNIKFFHEALADQGTDFSRRFVTQYDPIINVLISFTLGMPATEINNDNIEIVIYAFYFTSERKNQELTVWKRTKYLSVQPTDYQDIKLKMENTITELVEQYMTGQE